MLHSAFYSRRFTGPSSRALVHPDLPGGGELLLHWFCCNGSNAMFLVLMSWVYCTGSIELALLDRLIEDQIEFTALTFLHLSQLNCSISVLVLLLWVYCTGSATLVLLNWFYFTGSTERILLQ